MREDIQCLRGLAITFVYLYHLHPTSFVNGFLGVDIFFVISGFLMAKNLTKNKITKVTDFFIFYYKRFKRILPLYFLVIFVTVIMVQRFLGEFWWWTNWRYSVASLFVVTNHLVITDSADYFKQFQTDDKSPNLFLHLWSLGVEMQFYLIVPFIFFALQILRKDILKFIAVILTTIIGCVPFLLLNQHFSFNFMPLRLWQFAAGFCALFYRRLRESSKETSVKTENATRKSEQKLKSPIGKEDVITVFVAILSFSIFPKPVDIQYLRPLVTFATAVVIAAESKDNQILKTQFLVYIGNISYIIYLVHWPILSVFSIRSSFQGDLFVTLLTLFTSIFLHHLFEKQYLKLGWKSITSLLLFLILVNSALQYSIRSHEFWKPHYPEEVQKMIDENWNLQDVWKKEPEIDKCVESKEHDPWRDTFDYKYCLYPPGKGNFSIMMIGNSYVKNLNEHVRAHFHYNYSEYRYSSITGGHALYVDKNDRYPVDLHRKQVEKYKPDVLFITARYSDTLKRSIQPNDTLVQEMNDNIAFYEKFVKKIYILNALPLFKVNFLNHFMQYIIQEREDLESLHLDQKVADKEKLNAVKRFSMMKCSKCKIYDLSPTFLENGKYLAFNRDRMLAYVDNLIHVTAPGLALFEKMFEDNAREIMDTI
ncbi:hypothetical protein CAEBREN_29543 [Caenorhabditis brenneri]|uniref:Acyl_transf_3 domain-containing protein n=1 Tax=Caenorhabditis brenneri TaxID=135651 RepID=G0PIS5_CAEBE|nr:hypothetical protein CAEBREN_29543 [Caenorhabditis brenneri]